MPYYEQLKRLIAGQIESGMYGPGDMLPAEWELCNTYQVSRTVVRQALGELVNEGQLYRQRGKGTFVAARPSREQFIESTVGYFEDLPSGGDTVHRKVLAIRLAEPPQKVADALSLAPGTQCVEVERLRYVDGDIHSYTKHYLPTALHPDLLAALRDFDLESQSLYTFLEEVCGIRIRSGHRTLEAAATSPRVARLLETSPGAPVLHIRGLGRDVTEQPVELFDAWHRSDRTQVDIEVAGPTRSASVVSP
ncbi:GntR family transcriptional regulator [Georgenia sp. AZ-5]|uniref:GntR family transcriptional regulator n=1 Tax=Georgenia sp. AZ-5 TaxID=3367526 RepID=UPI0037540BD6